MAEKIEGQVCPICNAGKIIRSPKSGKLFCDKKCWLNIQGGSTSPAPSSNGNKSEQDLRSIVTSYSKDIVVALINAGHIKKSETAIANIKGIAFDLYNYVSGQDKKPEIKSYVD